MDDSGDKAEDGGMIQLGGHDVRVEGCVNLGRVIVHPSDADRVL